MAAAAAVVVISTHRMKDDDTAVDGDNDAEVRMPAQGPLVAAYLQSVERYTMGVLWTRTQVSRLNM